FTTPRAWSPPPRPGRGRLAPSLPGPLAHPFQPVTGAPAAVEQPEPGLLIVLAADGRIHTAAPSPVSGEL
ncbi:hypothetical protein ACFQ9Q_42700, partial [Streptomyces virginiae]|uniref:hypothetical protein n=1 Tax=Streptomyces virginiae TaxID=1961 RepID=UPI003687E3CA